MERIATVKELHDRGALIGWIVNGATTVLNDERAAGYHEVQDWIAAGNAPEAADPVPEPSYREKRKAAYIAELGADPSFENTVGDVLDAVIKAFHGDTAELDAMTATIADIKQRFPKE